MRCAQIIRSVAAKYQIDCADVTELHWTRDRHRIDFDTEGPFVRNTGSRVRIDRRFFTGSDRDIARHTRRTLRQHLIEQAAQAETKRQHLRSEIDRLSKQIDQATNTLAERQLANLRQRRSSKEVYPS